MSYYRNTVQLTLNIEDRNDNPPEFALAKYEARLYENQPDFNPPLFLHAEDADLNGMTFFLIHVLNEHYIRYCYGY